MDLPDGRAVRALMMMMRIELKTKKGFRLNGFQNIRAIFRILGLFCDGKSKLILVLIFVLSFSVFCFV